MEKPYASLDKVAIQLELKNLTPEIDLSKIKIYTRSVNRPAFQLAGYYDYFDSRRIQILGKAEHEYIERLTYEERMERFDKLFSYKVPVVILCRGLEVQDDIINAGRKYGVPVLYTRKSTDRVMVDIINGLNKVFAPRTTKYGVLVDVYGEGILIQGASGIGKSETAIELIKRGHRFVADDIIEIARAGESLLLGRSPELTRHFAELRGIGVVDVMSLYGVESVREEAPINMIIYLDEWDGSNNYDRLGLNVDYEDILGVKVVTHHVPVRPGRNLALIIETAAVNNRQKKMGYNAAQELCDRLQTEVRRKEQNKNE